MQMCGPFFAKRAWQKLPDRIPSSDGLSVGNPGFEKFDPRSRVVGQQSEARVTTGYYDPKVRQVAVRFVF